MVKSRPITLSITLHLDSEQGSLSEVLQTIQRSITVMSETTDRLNAATDKIVAATTAVQEATDTMQSEVGAAIADLKDQIAQGDQSGAIAAAVARLEAAEAALTATKNDLATTLAPPPAEPSV